MTDTPAGGNSHHLRRWLDRALIATLGLLVTIIAAIFGTLWLRADNATSTNVRQDPRIEHLESTVNRMDGKLDQILREVRFMRRED